MKRSHSLTRRGLTQGLGALSFCMALPQTPFAMSRKPKVLQTPDERFTNLSGFDFTPHYLEVPHKGGTIRMHYLDEGDPNADTILLLHGQGQWCYTYRNMIPQLVSGGYRVIAPDFIGFGRSDKLLRDEDYSFNDHVSWLTSFLTQMKLKNCTAYMFDWGGYFGLRIAAEKPDLFDRIALSNTQLPIATDPKGSEWFKKWRAGIMKMKAFPMGNMVNSGATTKLSPEEIAGYDAPFPDESYKTGPRRFPFILPITEDMGGIPENRAAWEKLETYTKPTLTIFSDPVMGMSPTPLQNQIAGAKGQNHIGLKGAGFYITDDRSDEIANILLNFAAS